MESIFIKGSTSGLCLIGCTRIVETKAEDQDLSEKVTETKTRLWKRT